MKNILFGLILIAGVTGIESCQTTKSSTATRLLKFNLEKGKGYDYEMIVNMDQDIMGKPMRLDMTTYYSMDVSAEEADTRTIVTSFERFKMSTEVSGFTLQVDTDDPVRSGDSGGMKDPVSSLKKMLGAIRGQKFTMKVNAEGRITEISGFENMAENIVDSLALDEKQKDAMRREFEGQFNAAEMKQSLERFWYIFPNKEVKVGDSWEKNSESTGKMPARYRSTYTVKDIEGDMVTLEEVSKIEAREDEKVRLTGEITGDIVVDSRSGLVVTATQDMTIKASADGIGFEMKGKSRIKGKAR